MTEILTMPVDDFVEGSVVLDQHGYAWQKWAEVWRVAADSAQGSFEFTVPFDVLLREDGPLTVLLRASETSGEEVDPLRSDSGAIANQPTVSPVDAPLSSPEPPSLREQVARAWCAEYYGEFSGSAKHPDDLQLAAADAVLAVVADWLAAQPLRDRGRPRDEYNQRDHDVRLVGGQS